MVKKIFTGLATSLTEWYEHMIRRSRTMVPFRLTSHHETRAMTITTTSLLGFSLCTVISETCYISIYSVTSHSNLPASHRSITTHPELAIERKTVKIHNHLTEPFDEIIQSLQSLADKMNEFQAQTQESLDRTEQECEVLDSILARTRTGSQSRMGLVLQEFAAASQEANLKIGTTDRVPPTRIFRPLPPHFPSILPSGSSTAPAYLPVVKNALTTTLNEEAIPLMAQARSSISTAAVKPTPATDDANKEENLTLELYRMRSLASAAFYDAARTARETVRLEPEALKFAISDPLANEHVRETRVELRLLKENGKLILKAKGHHVQIAALRVLVRKYEERIQEIDVKLETAKWVSYYGGNVELVMDKRDGLKYPFGAISGRKRRRYVDHSWKRLSKSGTEPSGRLASTMEED